MKKEITTILKTVLLVLILSGGTLLNSYAQEFKDGMLQGTVRIKIKPSLAQAVKISKSASTGIISTGITELDRLNSVYSVTEMKRVFRYSPQFEEKHKQYGLNLWYEVSISPTITADQAVIGYSQLQEIEKAEPIREKNIIDGSSKPIYLSKSVASTGSEYFNDPYLSQQWHYNNTGQSGGTPGSDINVYKAWDITKGSKNVIVSIHDMGVDVKHEDLKDAMWINKAELNGTTGVDDDGNGYKDDVNGFNFSSNRGTIDAGFHGTHVAGTIGASNNNTIGVSGIAGGSGTGDGVRLMSCQILGGTGSSNTPDSYVYAADMGAVISQNSWGYSEPEAYEQSVLDAIDYFIAEAGNYPGSPMKGGVVFFAAGNSAWEYPSYPGFYAPCISVAALNASSNVTVYSNYGTWVDLSAPGGQVEDDANIDPNSEFKNGVLSTLENDAYGFMDGTSMACPHVTGVAALIVSKFGDSNFTNTELKNRILTGTRFIDDIPGNEYYAGKIGSGAMDAALALATDNKKAPNKITDLVLTGIAQDFAIITWSVPADNDDVKPVKFEVLYSTQEISASSIQFAKTINLDNHLKPGETELLEIANLKPLTKYYFSVRSIDRWQNTSDFSNSVSGTTNAGPDAQIDPNTTVLEMVVDVSVDPIASSSFDLLNIGEGQLNWDATTHHQNAYPNSIKTVNFPKIQPSHTSNGGKIVSSDAGKVGHPIAFAIDKPTNETMSYLDPNFWDLWVIGDTDTTYTNSSATLFQVTNPEGFNLTSVGAFLVHKEITGPIIMEIYDGQSIADAKLIYNQEVQNTPDYGYTGITLTEHLFFEQGRSFWIVFHVPSMNKFPLGAGLEGAKEYSKNCYYSSNLGKTWKMLEDVYFDNQLVWAVNAVSEFSTIGQYIKLSPESGTVSTNSQTTISASVDGSTMVNGNYSASISINTNETNEPLIRLPVYLTIQGHKPVIKTEMRIDAGGVIVGTEKIVEVKLRNEGLALFQFSDYGYDSNWNSVFFKLSNPQFSYVSGLNTYFESGTEQTVSFKLKPTQSGNISSTVEMKDAQGNTFTFNLVGYGIDPPVMELLPAEALFTNLTIGDTIKGHFELKNKGNYPLDYFFPAFADGSNMAEISSTIHKYGYSCALNSAGENTSLIYNWTDISLSGIDVTANLNDQYEKRFTKVDLGFEFPYFGKNETSVYISRYSTLSFDTEGYIWSRNPLQFKWEGLPDRIISVLGIETTVENTGHIYFKRFTDKFIVQWENVPIGGIANASYQAVLHDNGDINIYIKNIELGEFTLETIAMSSFIGIEDQTQNDGILINDYSAINIDALANGTAIEFVSPGQGLFTSLTNPFGTVQPGESIGLDYTLTTDSLYVAKYREKLAVITNDPIVNTGLFTANFEITGGGVPNVVVSNTDIDFGQVFQNDTKTASIFMGNTGKAPTTIMSAVFTNGYYTIDGTFPEVLKPGMAIFYNISQVSSTVGAFNDKLVLTTSQPKTYEISLSGEVIEAPEISINISKITETLESGNSKMVEMIVSNNGKHHLDFAPLGNSWISVSEKSSKQVPEVPNYTYQFKSSKDEGGPEFNWLEISEPENKITVGDIWFGENPWSEKIDLPFMFNFYGNEYNYLYVGYNGLVSFTPDQELNPFGGDAIPNAEMPNNFIAALYGFIGPVNGADAYKNTGYYCKIEDDRVIIEFCDFNTGFWMTEPMSIEMILFKNGNIKFQYKLHYATDADIITPFGVIGVENIDGTDGVTIANRTYVNRNELAYELFPSKKFNIPAGESKEFNVTLNANELFADQYNDELKMINNAPLSQGLTIPVQLTVTGAAEIIAPNSVEFGDVLVVETQDQWGGSSLKAYEEPFEIENSGTAKSEIFQFDISKMTNSTAYAYVLTQDTTGNWVYDWMEVSALPMFDWTLNQTLALYLQPKAVMKYKVVTTPSMAGTINDTLIIITDNGDLTIPVNGESFMPPSITTPDTVKVYAEIPTYTETKSVTIDNTLGGYELLYSLEIDYKRPEMTNLPSKNSNFTSTSSSPVLLSKKIAIPTKKTKSIKGDYNRELSYENFVVAETGLGYGGATPFYSSTTFQAPSDGFNLTHVQTWYVPGTWLNSKIKVQVYAGNRDINQASLIHSQTYDYNITEPSDLGEMLTIQLEKNLIFFPNEYFFVVFGYESGATYPQGVGTITNITKNRYNYSSGNGQWFDITDAGASLQSFGWIVRALEADYQSAIWVSLASNDSSTVPAGTTGNISIDFNAAVAKSGYNNANLIISSNDPLQPKKVVSLLLHLNKGPEMDISETGLTVNENEIIQFQAVATDIEGDNFTMAMKSSPGFVTNTVSNNKMNITCSPTFNDAGEHFIIIEAVDNHGNKSETTVLLRVKNINRAPFVIDPIGDFGINSNDMHNLNLATVISDEDNESLVYTVTSTDESIIKLFLSNDAVIFAPQSAGIVTITITGTDAEGLSATYSFNITAWGVGIDANRTENFSLYPNPANHEVTLNLPSDLQKSTTVKITNLIGVILFEQKLEKKTSEYKLNISTLAEGIYLIKIENDGFERTLNLIKN